MSYHAGQYDIAVIGGGHAGCEAALAAARLGARVVLFAISLDSIANMPCNPSIGGTAKGHLVREIDALGGAMGKIADRTMIQSRMLGMGKGPAVHSLRAQADRLAYSRAMKHLLEKTPGLYLRQGEIVALGLGPDGHLHTVETSIGERYEVRAAILATGTYLGGLIHIGEASIPSGPDQSRPALALSDCLRTLGVPLVRFKTGTPPRILRSSIDFDRLEEQPGDDPVVPFSFETTERLCNRATCHITYTNAETHRIIRENLHRSAMYGGQIEGTGPRYCPSIEDKIVRFPDKARHQIFVEPMGLDTEEIYLQGLSTSMPADVQAAIVHSMAGLERAVITRPAYAIEYDCCDPTCLTPALEMKAIPGLYGAGQFNGTSGYEEAAAQGLIAGINAVRALQGREPLILGRDTSYIGTLIDDLVTKGVLDPYRMMTSRSEYRLLLRQDNADERLTPIGRELGLIDDARWERFRQKMQTIEAEIDRLRRTTLPPSAELNGMLQAKGEAPITTGTRMAELLKRPKLGYRDLAPFDPNRPELSDAEAEECEIKIKYEGYLKRQQAQVEAMRALEAKPLPPDLDYPAIDGLRLEAREKLAKIQPRNLGQAGRISGVTPADLTVLLIWLAQHPSGPSGKEESDHA